MKIKIKDSVITPDAFLSRAFYLAYQACGRSQGMGIFQEMRLGGVPATEQQVFQNVLGAEDYGGRCGQPTSEVYADYVFGRMMKWGVSVKGDVIECRNAGPYRSDYQGFACTYKTAKDLFDATAKSYGVEYVEVTENN